MLHMTGIVADYRSIPGNSAAKTGEGKFPLLLSSRKEENYDKKTGTWYYWGVRW